MRLILNRWSVEGMGKHQAWLSGIEEIMTLRQVGLIGLCGRQRKSGVGGNIFRLGLIELGHGYLSERMI